MVMKIRGMVPDGFTNQIFCAGIPGARDSPCHGDSGGPALKFVSSRKPNYVLTGIMWQQCSTKVDPWSVHREGSMACVII